MNTHFTDAIKEIAKLNERYLSNLGNTQAIENIEHEFKTLLEGLLAESKARLAGE